MKPEIITPVRNIPLSELTDKEKIMVASNILIEMSTYRIARALGMSHHTITSYVKRGLKKLRGFKIF